MTWKPTATGFSFTNDSVNPQGQITHAQSNGTFDGTPYAFKGATFSGMRTTKWVDAFTIAEVDTVNGKATFSRTGVISKDGKTLTVTSKGVNAEGKPTSNTTVYEKQ